MTVYENMMQGSTSPTQQGFTPRQLPVTLTNNNKINHCNNNRIDLTHD